MYRRPILFHRRHPLSCLYATFVLGTGKDISGIPIQSMITGACVPLYEWIGRANLISNKVSSWSVARNTRWREYISKLSKIWVPAIARVVFDQKWRLWLYYIIFLPLMSLLQGCWIWKIKAYGPANGIGNTSFVLIMFYGRLIFDSEMEYFFVYRVSFIYECCCKSTSQSKCYFIFIV